MNKFSIILVILVVGLGLWFVSSRKTTIKEPPLTGDDLYPVFSEDDEELVPGVAYVDDLQIEILESFPVRVRATISGNLADGCTMLGDVLGEKAGNTYTLHVGALRSPVALCTQALVPFTKVVMLNVENLPAGTYTVVAGEIVKTFTLDVDNVSDIPPPNAGSPEFDVVDGEPRAGVLISEE